MKLIPGVIAAAVLISSTAMAQYPRDDRAYDRGGYDRRGVGPNVVRSVIVDLEQAASRGYMNGRERNRIDQALRNLSDFEREMSRGRFDRHALDKGIERIDDVVRRGGIDPRARNILSADLYRLREFRATGGSFGYRR